jgi:hypothetical protein
MDFGDILRAMIEGQADPPPPPAPKWLRGRTVCPLLIGGDLFWRCSEMVVRGIPPVGVQYGHSDPHILPAEFGPVGEPRQVMPGAPLLNGLVPMQNELGETLSYTYGRTIRFVSATLPPYFFVYPPHDDAPQLIAVMQGGNDMQARDPDGRPARVFRTFAFLAPATKNIHHFLLPEERERLPRYAGTMWEDEDDGLHGVGIEISPFPYDPTDYE